MQSMPTTALASPATSSGRSDLGDERAVLAGAELVLLQLPPFISRTGHDRAAQPARSGDATRARRWPMSTETLMRRRAAALPEDPSSTVDGVQCDGAGELGLDGLSIGVESREQLAGSRLQALVSYDDLTRHINLRSLQDSNGNHDRHGPLDAGIEERDQPITCDGGRVGRREVDHEGAGPRKDRVSAHPSALRRWSRAGRSGPSGRHGIPASLVPSGPRKACAVPQYAAPE
jgi:hypothetical protein